MRARYAGAADRKQPEYLVRSRCATHGEPVDMRHEQGGLLSHRSKGDYEGRVADLNRPGFFGDSFT